MDKTVIMLKNHFCSILIKFAYFSDGSSTERCPGVSCRMAGMAPGCRCPGTTAAATRNEFPGK